ncbi:Pentatricopeptide repeat-containing protein [Nymphaea thermarum]|nr:Pentatricopeptide repeat-containing protein [Nymphaea thermarum]
MNLRILSKTTIRKSFHELVSRVFSSSSQLTFAQLPSLFLAPLPRPPSPSASVVLNGEGQSVSEKIVGILKDDTPIGAAFHKWADVLSQEMVSWILAELDNVKREFRFFAWAMREKRLRSWASHAFMIQSLVKNRGFDSAWESLEEMREGHHLIVPQVFAVLISAYAESGMVEKAVEAFGKMGEFGSRPNTFTYNTILWTLIEERVFELALAVYNQMVKRDCRPNRSTFNILIDGLCKAGRMSDALLLFDEMAEKNIRPDTMTYTIVLSGLCRARRIDDAQLLLMNMEERGCGPDAISYNSLLDGFCKAGMIDRTSELLQSFRKNGFSLGLNGHSCLIDGLFRAGLFDSACKLYRKMVAEEIAPDCVLYTIMIKGLCSAGRLDDAFGILKEMTEKGLVPDTYCYNTLIKGLCDCGFLDRARSLQLEISKTDCFPDSATYTILICGLCKEGLISDAEKIFNEMGNLGCLPTVVTFNSLINGLCNAGHLRQAHILFYRMEMGSNPSLFLRLSQGADRVHNKDELREMVEKLCDSGQILKAYKLLKGLAESGVLPDIVTYNILINGLCKHKNIDGAFKLFNELQIKGYQPDAITYNTLIDGLQRVNRDDDAFSVFEQMVKYGCTPGLEVYNAVMGCLCRKGKVAQACTLWLRYISSQANHSDKEARTIEVVQGYVDQGDVVGAVKELVDLDVRRNMSDSLPYVIWLVGLCKAARVDEALEIFYILQECNLDISLRTCVVLINCLLQEGRLLLAVEVFLYALGKGFILTPPICNRLLRHLCLSDREKESLEIVQRMSDAGYDLEIYLHRSTKTLLYDWNR